MKVLITTDTYFPMINGVVTSVNNLYDELKKNGHEVRILTLSHNGADEVVGDVYYLKSIGIGIYPDARVKVPFHNKLVKELVDWKLDVIHSQTEFSTMLVAKHISRKLNIPLIHTYHTMYEDYLDYLLGGKVLTRSTAAKLTRVLLNSLDGVVAPTEKTRNTLLGYGVDTDIFTVPTGIDLNRFNKEISPKEKDELLKELSINSDDRVIAYVGRVAQEKNLTEIITLFNDVAENDKNVKLLIVGGGPYLNTLKSQVHNGGLEGNVIFTGMIAPEEIHKYYKIAEVFVTASTSETQGLTYIEALASGCPVVCKWDPCMAGLISQGKNGYAYKNSWEFSCYINEILHNTNLRNKMKRQATSSAQEYSTDAFGRNVLQVYERAANTRNHNIAFLQLGTSMLRR